MFFRCKCHLCDLWRNFSFFPFHLLQFISNHPIFPTTSHFFPTPFLLLNHSSVRTFQFRDLPFVHLHRLNNHPCGTQIQYLARQIKMERTAQYPIHTGVPTTTLFPKEPGMGVATRTKTNRQGFHFLWIIATARHPLGCQHQWEIIHECLDKTLYLSSISGFNLRLFRRTN